MENLFLSLFRLCSIKNLKIFCFGTVAANGAVPDAIAFWHVFSSGTGRHLLGLPGFFMRQTVCPKSWVSGRKLRISNSSLESQKKEKVSPPGWYWLNLCALFRQESASVTMKNIKNARIPAAGLAAAALLKQNVQSFLL